MRAFLFCGLATSATVAILAACGQSSNDATEGAALSNASANDSTADAGNVVCAADSGGAPYTKYKTAFFGNLHQHTSFSLDANSFGTRTAPGDAYLFAKGMSTITVASGTDGDAGPTIGPLPKGQALDFLAVTDHSEWLGVLFGCSDKTSGYYFTQDCRRVRSTAPLDQAWTFTHMPALYTEYCAPDAPTSASCTAEQLTAWQLEQRAAANANDPCKFTSLIGYEWTSTPGGDTNHRNIVFGTSTVPVNPLDSNAYPMVYAPKGSEAGSLFGGLDQQCTGDCQALVIPHNTNLSKGTSITLPQSEGELVAMRKYQRLVEIYQHKGSSECFFDPDAGPDSGQDPACAFEYKGGKGDTPLSYVRTALTEGVQYAVTNETANPLQLGIIASVDDHNGAAGYVNEDNYVGHLGHTDDTPSQRLAGGSTNGPGGLAVVWAEQNTRDAIFGALERRETYGTSGPKIQLRFYETTTAAPCTADFPKTIIDQKAAIPMGGTFGTRNVSGDYPTFAIAAWPDASLKQPLAGGAGGSGVAGLAEVQIIKAHGTTTIMEDKPVEMPIAAEGQCLTWQDKNWKAGEQAFYYVRVMQVPTWRWSHFDCQATNAPGCEKGGDLDVTITERAWSSPIWFVP